MRQRFRLREVSALFQYGVCVAVTGTPERAACSLALLGWRTDAAWGFVAARRSRIEVASASGEAAGAAVASRVTADLLAGV